MTDKTDDQRRKLAYDRAEKDIFWIREQCDALLAKVSRSDPVGLDISIQHLLAARKEANISFFMLNRGHYVKALESLISAWGCYHVGSTGTDRYHVEIGASYSKSQAARGKIGAEVRWLRGQNQQLRKIIRAVSQQVGMTAAELWPELYGQLDVAGLDPYEPQEQANRCEKPKRTDYYLYGPDRASITFDAFRKAIRRERTKKT